MQATVELTFLLNGNETYFCCFASGPSPLLASLKALHQMITIVVGPQPAGFDLESPEVAP